MGQQLAQMASGFAEAMVSEAVRNAKCKSDAERVASTIPDDPPRGSYYWWARLCREFTGAHFLDSGGAYGYQYQKGIIPEDGPHMRLTLYGGKPEYWNISLPMWLTTMLEADDEIAIALENVVNWAGEWLYPREGWYTITGDIGAILNMLYGCIWKDGRRTIFHNVPIRGYWKSNPKDMGEVHDWANKGDVGKHIYAAWIVRYYLGKIVSVYDLHAYQRDMSDDEYIAAALADLPVKDVKFLYENEVRWTGHGWYTYGTDNDLDQDVHIDAEFEDAYGERYLILRTHNGCDARGGFSSPVAAKYEDADYFRCYEVDGYCFACGYDYYSTYNYGHEMEKKKKNPPIEAWRASILVQDQIKVGQATFLPVEDWKWRTNIDVARTVVEYMEEDEERDFPALVCGDKENTWVPDEDGGYETIPNERVAGMLCPKCGEYTVRFHSMVYGF